MSRLVICPKKANRQPRFVKKVAYTGITKLVTDSMDIPEPLTTSFRNIKNIIPKHFDHPNALIHRGAPVLKLTQLTKRMARNRVVRH